MITCIKNLRDLFVNTTNLFVIDKNEILLWYNKEVYQACMGEVLKYAFETVCRSPINYTALTTVRHTRNSKSWQVSYLNVTDLIIYFFSVFDFRLIDSSCS